MVSKVIELEITLDSTTKVSENKSFLYFISKIDNLFYGIKSSSGR